MLSFITIGVVTIVWTLWGYSLAYGTGELIPNFIGDFSLLGLNGVDMFSAEGDAISPLYDVLFQMMFALFFNQNGSVQINVNAFLRYLNFTVLNSKKTL